MKENTSKSTILIISIGFLFLHLTFEWQWAAYASLIIGIIGIISSFLSSRIEDAWMKLSRVLSYIIPSVMLSMVYYMLLVPISLLSKLWIKDPLMLSRKYGSYFININKEFDKKSFEKIW